MRKLFWCCAAVVAAGSAWAVHHAYRHPDSFMSRCAPAGIGDGLAAAAADLDKAPTNAEPTTHVGVVELPPLLTAPIVIDEEVKPAKIDGQPQLDKDEVLGLMRPLAIDLAGVPAPEPCSGACDCEPRHMPYSVGPEDGKPVEPMAPAEDAVTGADKGCDFFGFLLKVFCPKTSCEGHDGEPQGVEDRNYHQHFPGCPHTGGCPGMYRACPPAEKHESQKPNWHDEQPQLQGVDTMEFRPGDHSLNEYGPGGPF
jgi:hypothetical protein